MKTLVIALNSKYIHSSLAPWYLKSSCGNGYGEIKVLEFTINDSLDSILGEIYSEKADVMAFSCYIWNIAHVLKLIDSLKKVSPNIKIVLGGPEVSFDAAQLIAGSGDIDYILTGEGEVSFKLLLGYLYDNSVSIDKIDGLIYKHGERSFTNKPGALIENLDSIPSPFTDEMLASLGGRIVYFESSRGCPFSCSYCISSTFEGVRHFSFDRVKQDLMKLVNACIRQVKFVDRTFNCNRSRAKEIFKFIIENARQTLFHFEVAADLFDDEMLEILSMAPKGLIQFEIGVQTTNIKTLEAVNRKTALDRVFYNVERLNSLGNSNLHLDLIAGLPYENFDSFKKSFNEVYALRPHQLQLGFLKLLKGSRSRAEAEIHGYRFRSYPPYEVLCNDYIIYDELLELKKLEEILERYYNSGRFANSLRFIIGRFFSSAFEFYSKFSLFNDQKGYLERPMSSRELYKVIISFSEGSMPEKELKVLNDLLKYDFLSSDSSTNLPEGVERRLENNFKDCCFEFLKNDSNIDSYLPEFSGIPAKQIFKQVHFEVFDYDVSELQIKEEQTIMLYNYRLKDKVTGLYVSRKVPFSI